MKIIKYFFEALIIYISFFIIFLIGLKVSRTVFSYLFNKIGPLIKPKDIVNNNLKQVFGEQEDDKVKSLITNMWSNYGKVFVEYLYLSRFRSNNSHINLKGKNILDEIKKNGKPVIFISGHFANFELMSMELTKFGIDLATLYRPLNNFFLNPFMEYLRKRYICPNQIRKGIIGTRKILSFLKEGTSIALMIDQRLSEGKKIPFFNKNASTTTLPAQLALKYDCNIVPVSIKRDSNDVFEMEILSPINVTKENDVEKNKLEISLQLNKLLEKMVLNNPDQWIWTHNRWK
ncbi:MAG: lipid A biosynthesis acyltransferase [Pelagibacteraceae bacterium TMED170]|nr:MAG: lipid A biosynthesis acyltransferase [Pelagibacteraceae bacterium TMED170]|tara:strand:+ start:4840 stop:5706 length:867 start_codon:yes stop_codon:yes gene_type:complete